MGTEGIVYLVGAGPGDPGLLTLRGAECLRKADVVIYDHLANPDLLSHAREEAEKIYAGKEGGRHTLKQDEINRLMVERAGAGLKVVRLKGGDPFLFGRGGEEAEFLVEAGVPFEVIPGVSSALAAPAYAGIPLTHRDRSSSAAFVTGHAAEGKPGLSFSWEGLARGVETLVFLMGVGNLSEISERLMAAGRSAETPIAVIRWGTTPQQETVTGTLGDIVSKVQKAELGPPGVIVVGEVVGLRDRLNWFERRPLFGNRIVVTRAREQASAFADLLRAYGADVVEFPTISIFPPDGWESLDAAIDRLDVYDWVVFTSVNGVRFFLERLKVSGKDARALSQKKLCAIGPATGAALEGVGLRADLIPENYRAEGILAALREEEIRGKHFLIARAAAAREVLPQELRRRGAQVDVVECYRTEPGPGGTKGRELLLKGGIDLVTFTSSSTVENFAAMFSRDELERIRGNFRVAAIGPITAERARDLGLTPDLVADEYTVPALTEAIVKALGRLEPSAPPTSQ